MSKHPGLKSITLWIMAIATGLSVANLYYNQPLLADLQMQWGVSVKDIGLIPTLTQLGYAFGMLFLVPLGDMYEKRRLIIGSSLLVTLALLLAAASTSLVVMAVASLLIGLGTMTPQLIIPFGAHLAEPHKRGQVLGFLMSGLLIGILLSRTLSGIVGATWGWRSVFYSAGVLMVLIAVALRLTLPQSQPHFSGTYLKLMKSLGDLFREEPVLREAAFLGAMFFAVFSALWATLIFLLSSPHFGYGAKEVGLFGLLGVAGALAAPLVGRVSDRKSPRFGVAFGLACTVLSVVILWFSEFHLLGLIVGIFLMDMGVQGGHVSNQTRVFALRDDARSRLNTVYMFSYFMGGALGSMLGSMAWSFAGWKGVCALCLIFMTLGVLVFLRGFSRRVLNNSAHP